MKKLMMVAAATVAAWSSWGAESISVDEVINHYPWDGKVDCVYTLSAGVDCTYKGVFTLSVKKDGVAVRKVVTKDLTAISGTYTNTFDCTTLFGEGYYPNGGIKVELVKKPAGVQLWKDGPYFATCNVGATKPEEYGYQFWWGDTIGYKRNAANNGWDAVDGSATGFQFVWSNAKVKTYERDKSSLKSADFIDDSTGNLVAKYDAATAHLGAPWRMPTAAELQALVDNCTTTWILNWNGTGVNGRLFTGKGDYASKSIFLPATGQGCESYLYNNNWDGYYWSSTPNSVYNCDADYLYFYNSGIQLTNALRSYGRSVRPVRGFAK